MVNSEASDQGSLLLILLLIDKVVGTEEELSSVRRALGSSVTQGIYLTLLLPSFCTCTMGMLSIPRVLITEGCCEDQKQ